MAATTTAAELRELTNEELVLRVREAKEELFNLRFQSATGQLENHGRLRGHQMSPPSRVTIRHFIGSLCIARRSASRAVVSFG